MAECQAEAAKLMPKNKNQNKTTNKLQSFWGSVDVSLLSFYQKFDNLKKFLFSSRIRSKINIR